MKEFYEDFIKMQAELPSIMKSKQGQAGQGKFKYADLTEIVDTIRPIMAKHGFGFMQPLHSSETKTLISTVLIHKSGHIAEYSLIIDFQGEDIKKFGAAITYYRRYALQSILGLVADIDADDLPDTIGKKDKVLAEVTVEWFINQQKEHGHCELEDTKAFLTARAGYNKRSISENINDFIGRPESFNIEYNRWLNKRKEAQ